MKGKFTIAFGKNRCHKNHYVSAKTPINGYHKKARVLKTVFKMYVSIILFQYMIPKRLKLGKH